MTTDHTPLIRAMEDATLNGWPALSQMQSRGWIARFSEGVTGRANSVTALTAAPGSTDAAIDLFEPLYAARRLPSRFRLTPLSPPEAEERLFARGYAFQELTSVETLEIPGDVVADPAVRLTPRSDQAWRDAYQKASGRFNDADMAVIARLHQAIVPPTAFARVESGGVLLAFGFGVLEDGLLNLQEIATIPEARKRGLARRLIGTLMRWGREHGAKRAWLQVAAQNAPARALYTGLGFQPVYTYSYVTKATA